MKKMLFVLCALMGFAFGQSFSQDGVAAYKNKDYDKAIVNFTEAIRLSPKDATLYYNRGLSYMAKGDNIRAIADFEDALRLNPNHDKAKSSLETARQRQSGSTAPAAKASAIDELDISIRDASDYLNEKIPKGSKIVILNIQSNSSDLSDYIIDELIANAVNDGLFTVVDRQQLDVIRAEQKFQLSGVVDDKDALAIGKLFGAKTIVSGAVNRLGATGYRIRIRALEVQTAQVQGQFNRNIASSTTINSLMEGSGTANSGYATGTVAATTAVQATIPVNKPGATPTIDGNMVPGSSITEKLAWLQRSAESHGIYILEAKANENIAPHTFEYKGAINVTIVLRGDNVNRTIRLSSNGTMFKVLPNVTFILDNNITLHGHSGNNGNIVNVEGGRFKMNIGSTITGNIGGGGVYMPSGTFTMNGGTISGNGRGVYMGSGTFEMISGTISSNTAKKGGGVYMAAGTFTMTSGTISGNTASEGGGVYISGSIAGSGNFTMTGGTISGNTASKGGGAYISGSIVGSGNFTMRSGTIIGNTVNENGGGVCVGGGYGVRFTKTGGIITGYKDDQSNGNAVRDIEGILARRGHAVYIDDNKRKEATAGPDVNLDNYNKEGWDQ